MEACVKTQPNTKSKDPFELMWQRVHEAEGSGRRSFAMFQAARHPGPLNWIIPAHATHNPMLRGLPDGVGQRIHLIRPTNETDLLWATEETLRSPGPNLVISEKAIDPRETHAFAARPGTRGTDRLRV